MWDLASPPDWRRTAIIGVLSGIGVELLELFVTQPSAGKGVPQDSRLLALGELHRNWKLTLLFVVLAWTLAAFGEEMVYRGSLLNRGLACFATLRWPGWLAW